MKPQSMNVKSIFLQAIEEYTPEDWTGFLDEACAGNAKLRAEVERLLASHGSLGTFHEPSNSTGREKFPGPNDITAVDPVGEEIGPYKIGELLGEGGMGAVYVAEQTEPIRRKVALKIIKPGMDSKEVTARFEAERHALALMSHPNIARVLDGGTTDEGRPYFVMELVRGVPITDFSKQKKLPLRDRLELFADICKAVQHAHQKGIIHRDLKPSNIMVTLIDGTPVVKVIDFGVAKALNQELTERTLITQFSQIIGTPLYMSPEQAELSGLDIDTRSDIYSLGVILYELLTSTTPFDHDTMSNLGMDGIRQLLKKQEPQRPSARISTVKAANLPSIGDERQPGTEDISKHLKRELDWIVMKALEKDRERRYETANAFAADVQRYLNDEPVEACPPSVTYRLKKYARKHKGWLTTASLLIVMLVSSTAVSGMFAYQANEARIATEKSEEDAKEAQAEAETEKAKAVAARIRTEAAEANQRRLREKAESAERTARWTAYAVRVKGMANLLDLEDFAELAESIEQTSPASGEPDFRGWEWDFHKARLDARSQSLPIEISNARWRLNGNQIVVAVRPTFLELWDANRLESLARIDIGTYATRMRLSPSGEKIAIGGRDRRIRVVNLATFTVTGEYQPLKQGVSPSEFNTIFGLAWSPDETHLAAAIFRGDIVKIRLSDGVVTRLGDNVGHAYGLDWHPDGTRIAVGLWHGERFIIDLQTNEQQWLPEVSDERGDGIRWSPDGRLLAISEDSLVRVLDEQQRTVASFSGHRGRVGQIYWLDNKRFASVGVADQTCRIWDIEKQQFEKFLPFDPEQRNFLAISPDEQRVILQGQVGTQILRISDDQPLTTLDFAPTLQHDLADGEKLIQPNLDSFTTLVWSEDGSTLIASAPLSRDRHFLTVWNTATGLEVTTRSIEADHVLAFSRDTDWLFRPAAEKDGEKLTQIVERDSGLIWQTSHQQIGDQERRFQGIEFDANKTRLIGMRSDTTLGIFDVGTLEISQSYRLPEPVSYATGFSFDHAGRRLLTTGYYQPAIIFPDGAIHESTDGLTHAAFEGAWHVTGDLIAVAGRGKVVVLIDPKTMETVDVLRGHRGTIGGIDFSPDGRRLASASIDGTVRVWDTATGDELIQLNTDSNEQFDRIIWSPDGVQLAATTRNQKIFLWSAPQSDRSAMLGEAEIDTTGPVYSHWRENGDTKSWGQPIEAFGWRPIIAAFRKEFGGFDSPLSRTDIERWVARMVQRMEISKSNSAIDQPKMQPFDYGDLTQALTILCEGHHNAASAVEIADVALDWLNATEQGEGSIQPSSRLRNRVMLEKAKRFGELNHAEEADQQFEQAAQSARRRLVQSPSESVGYRQLIKIQMCRVKYAVDRLEKMLDAEDRSIEKIRNQHDFVLQLVDESRAIANKCPTQAYYIVPASPNVSSNVWLLDIEAKMKAIVNQIEE